MRSVLRGLFVISFSVASAGMVLANEEQSNSSSAASSAPVTESSKKPRAQKPVRVAWKPVTLRASIDLRAQSMTVYEYGSPVASWRISSGTIRHPTPRGNFRPKWKARMWYSRKYDMSPMPYSVFIYGGVAIHGTQYVRSLGRPASHGCIRLAPGHARAFYNLVAKHGMSGTRVKVHGTPNFRRYRPPAVASNRRRYRERTVRRRQSTGLFDFWW